MLEQMLTRNTTYAWLHLCISGRGKARYIIIESFEQNIKKKVTAACAGKRLVYTVQGKKGGERSESPVKKSIEAPSVKREFTVRLSIR